MHRAEVKYEHMSAAGLAAQLRDEFEEVSGKCAATIVAPTCTARPRRGPEAIRSLEAGACALVPRGQTCWRLGLAGAGALHLVTTWTEPFYVLVSEGFGSENQPPQSWFICAYEMLSPGKRNLEPPSLVPNKCPEYTLDYLMHVLMQ